MGCAVSIPQVHAGVSESPTAAPEAKTSQHGRKVGRVETIKAAEVLDVAEPSSLADEDDFRIGAEGTVAVYRPHELGREESVKFANLVTYIL